MLPLSPDPSLVPPRFVDAVRDFALEDAVLVGEFITHIRKLGVEPEWQPTADVIIRLAAILRQLVWERRGIKVHQRAGLGSASENMAALTSEMREGKLKPLGGQLVTGMLKVLETSILWDSEDETMRFRTEIDAQCDDSEIDALVEFLIEAMKRS